MSNQYIEKLETAFTQKGWRILEKKERIDWAISGIWTIQRSTKVSPIHLEFDGRDGLGSNKVTPMVSCDGCYVRQRKEIHIRFKNRKRQST